MITPTLITKKLISLYDERNTYAEKICFTRLTCSEIESIKEKIKKLDHQCDILKQLLFEFDATKLLTSQITNNYYRDVNTDIITSATTGGIEWKFANIECFDIDFCADGNTRGCVKVYHDNTTDIYWTNAPTELCKDNTIYEKLTNIICSIHQSPFTHLINPLCKALVAQSVPHSFEDESHRYFPNIAYAFDNMLENILINICSEHNMLVQEYIMSDTGITETELKILRDDMDDINFLEILFGEQSLSNIPAASFGVIAEKITDKPSDNIFVVTIVSDNKLATAVYIEIENRTFKLFRNNETNDYFCDKNTFCDKNCDEYNIIVNIIHNAYRESQQKFNEVCEQIIANTTITVQDAYGITRGIYRGNTNVYTDKKPDETDSCNKTYFDITPDTLKIVTYKAESEPDENGWVKIVPCNNPRTAFSVKPIEINVNSHLLFTHCEQAKHAVAIAKAHAKRIRERGNN